MAGKQGEVIAFLHYLFSSLQSQLNTQVGSKGLLQMFSNAEKLGLMIQIAVDGYKNSYRLLNKRGGTVLVSV